MVVCLFLSTIKNTKAFTLVELLVTVAILGLLATLSVVSYNEFRARSYDLHAISSVKSARLAQHAFIIDHEELIESNANGLHGEIEVNTFSGIPEVYATAKFVGFSSFTPEQLLPGYVFNPEISMYARLIKYGPTTSLQPLIAAVHCKGSTQRFAGKGGGVSIRAMTSMIHNGDDTEVLINDFNFDPVPCP
jgi:prepilin-type N-terminal cleavage/methylation domain-containing protein